MEVRKIREEDIEDAFVVYAKAFNKDVAVYRIINTGFSDYVRTCIDGGYAFAAYENEEMCGIVLAYEKPDFILGKDVYIDTLAVIPEHQKKGYGTKLLDTVFVNAVENGIEQLSLRTLCYIDAYQIYRKYGFKDSMTDMRYMYFDMRKDMIKKALNKK